MVPPLSIATLLLSKIVSTKRIVDLEFVMAIMVPKMAALFENRQRTKTTFAHASITTTAVMHQKNTRKISEP